MRKSIIAIFCAFLGSSMAWADYQPERLKNFITETEDIFKVTNWEPSDDGSAWIAKTKLKNTVLSVGRKQSGIISFLSSSEEATDAIIRCVALAHYGVQTKTESQRIKLVNVVNSAVEGKPSSIKLNKVKFEAKAQEVGNVVSLSCQLTPSKI